MLRLKVRMEGESVLYELAGLVVVLVVVLVPSPRSISQRPDTVCSAPSPLSHQGGKYVDTKEKCWKEPDTQKRDDKQKAVFRITRKMAQQALPGERQASRAGPQLGSLCGRGCSTL
ncbi:hypothetical protein E2C01_041284 [Portunus trituberculatus]|uniref:Uncharacterized protein n=1 Tax=Portunus trituberculatus TaxID=210409 RepID=A0A5B7FQ07_PORTR|nr:hypothetical protein [Portunus trituberculatus]